LHLPAANRASAVAAHPGKKPHRGLPAPVEHRLGINPIASPDRLSEKLVSRYDPASDSPVAAEAIVVGELQRLVEYVARYGVLREDLRRQRGNA
jgi:hypothetical protein